MDWLMIFALLLQVSVVARVDDGNGFDPHGRPLSAASRCTDEGNGLDPHGGPCTQSLTIDKGLGLDPNG